MWETLRDPLVRAVRTFVQAFLAVFLASDVVSLSGFTDVALLDQAATAGIVAVLSLVQNLVEDTSGVTGLK